MVANLATTSQAIKSLGMQKRREQCFQFLTNFNRARNDVDTSEIANQADSRFVEPWIFDLGFNSPTGTPVKFYIGGAVGGVASVNQVLFNTATGFGGNALILVTGLAVKVNGKGSAVTLLSDLFGLAGQIIQITKQYGDVLQIPIEDALSMSFSAGSAALGADQNFPERRFVVGSDNPLIALAPKDKLNIQLVNANGATVVAGHQFSVCLYGQQLRVGQ